MNDSLKFSIIVPIYNSEKYLAQSLSSIICQSYTNLELILVNDGSTDRSHEICEEFQQKDPRVRLLEQENKGASSARNKGMQVASGDYLIFLDSDDYWDDTDALNRIRNRLTMTNAEILNYSYKKFVDGTDVYTPYFNTTFNMPLNLGDKYKQMQYLTAHSLYIASPCNKTIQTDLIKRHGIFFPEDSSTEDIEWCGKLLFYAQSLDYICENFYCYRQNTNSKRYNVSIKTCEDLEKGIKNVLCLTENHSNRLLKECLYQYLSFQYSTFFLVQAQAEQVPYETIEKMFSYQWLLKYHLHNRKIQILYILDKVLGYRNLCRTIRFLFQHKK